MDIAESILDLIGNTPLVKLPRLSESQGLTATLAVKLETTNPGGSVKDRPAVAMIDAAERDGLLQPGGTIVEPTSGNTGVGLAIVAAQRGYRCIFVMTDKMAPEKIALLRAYGAEVVVCPVAVAAGGPASRTTRPPSGSSARSPARSGPNQYANPANPLAHERHDRPGDLAADRRPGHPLRRRRRHGRHDHRRRPLPQVAEPGRADHRRRPGGLGVLGRHRAARTSSRASARTSGPTTYDPSLVDRVDRGQRRRRRSSRPAASRARRALLIGGSGGTAVAAALEVAQAAASPTTSSSCSSPTPAAATCRRSSTTTGWPTSASCATCDLCVGDVLDARGARRCRRSSTSTPTDRCARRSTLMREPRRLAAARCARTSRRSRRPRCRARSTSSS